LFTAAAHADSQVGFVECEPALCGGFQQNTATLSATRLQLVGSLAWPGQLQLQVVGLVDKATQIPAANRTLELYYGTLLNLGVDVIYLGSVSTDSQGRYTGVLPYYFGSDIIPVSNFYINDPAAQRTQFISGLLVNY
jgi:hypothetical protein